MVGCGSSCADGRVNVFFVAAPMVPIRQDFLVGRWRHEIIIGASIRCSEPLDVLFECVLFECGRKQALCGSNDLPVTAGSRLS